MHMLRKLKSSIEPYVFLSRAFELRFEHRHVEAQNRFKPLFFLCEGVELRFEHGYKQSKEKQENQAEHVVLRVRDRTGEI